MTDPTGDAITSGTGPHGAWSDNRTIHSRLPNLASMNRREQLKALRSQLVGLMVQANSFGEAARAAEARRERALADWRLVLAEISALENGT